MTWLPISQTPTQYMDSNGDPYSGAVLKFYQDGTSTGISLATDNTGGTQATSVALNSLGFPEISSAVIIPHTEESYKIVLYPTQAAADANSGAIWTVDAITPAINTGTNTDTLVKVSSNDTTAGYLNGKLVAGANVSMVEGSDGGNETLTIALRTGFQDGHLFGLGTSLGPSPDNDTAHDVLVAVGSCVDSSNAFSMTLTTALTKRIDANWQAGDTNGGFPSALSLSTATWYHLFLIATSAGVVDCGWDTSLTAANLLSDASAYTYYRRIGSHLTDGSSNITAYYQYKDDFSWSAATVPVSFNATTIVAATPVILSVPTGLQIYAEVTVTLDHVGTATQTTVRNNALTDSISSETMHHVRTSSSAGYNSSTFHVLTDTSATVNHQSDSTGATLIIQTQGWRDDRGKL